EQTPAGRSTRYQHCRAINRAARGGGLVGGRSSPAIRRAARCGADDKRQGGALGVFLALRAVRQDPGHHLSPVSFLRMKNRLVSGQAGGAPKAPGRLVPRRLAISTNQTVSRCATAAANSSASRVLPTPAGPVSLISRAPASRWPASASSLRRPTKPV